MRRERWADGVITVARPEAGSNPLVIRCFDGVFGPNTGQADFYEATADGLLKAFVCGEDCAVLAYGQTGSGKSYTVFGPRGDPPLPARLIHVQSLGAAIGYRLLPALKLKGPRDIAHDSAELLGVFRMSPPGISNASCRWLETRDAAPSDPQKHRPIVDTRSLPDPLLLPRTSAKAAGQLGRRLGCQMSRRRLVPLDQSHDVRILWFAGRWRLSQPFCLSCPPALAGGFSAPPMRQTEELSLNWGLLPRCIAKVLQVMPQDALLTVSAVEVYCEEVYDLLDGQKPVKLVSTGDNPQSGKRSPPSNAPKHKVQLPRNSCS